MKIHGQYPKPTAGDRNVQGPKANEEGKQASKTALKADIQAKPVQPELTMAKVRAKIEAEPDIDMAKVEAIKQRIKSGEYKVDSKLLASNLIKGSLLEDN